MTSSPTAPLPRRARWRTLARRLLEALCVLALALTLPRWWCGRHADGLYRGQLDTQRPMAQELIGWTQARLGQQAHQTGSARYDGEWAFVACQMTVLGLGQWGLAHPDQRDAVLPAMEACLDWMVTPDALAFGARAWGRPALELSETNLPAAYLGYLNMALGMHRALKPKSRFAALHDRLTQAFVARLNAAPLHRFETYPGETYPPDLATVIGSIGLHGQATGADHTATLDRCRAQWRAWAIDPDTTLVRQSLNPLTGAVVDGARGSGTAFSVYFLAFATPALSAEHFDALQHQLAATTAGFGHIDEFPPGTPGRLGDIDSGPVVFGIGPSATAFALAGARIHGDADLYAAIWRTAWLMGAPTDRANGATHFLLGGPIGNALLFAMATAPPNGRIRP